MQLSADSRDRYRRLCEQQGANIPLFQQAWWLDAVCQGKEWGVLTSERAGEPVGALPFLYGRKWGIPYVLQPQLTLFTGPWLADPTDTSTLRSLAASLIRLRFPLCMLRCAPEFTDADTLHSVGFTVSPRITHRLDTLRPLPDLMAAASPLRRRDFDRITRTCTLDLSVPPTELAALHDTHFRGQGGRSWVEPSFISSVATAAIARGHGLAAGLRDSSGRLLSATFTVFDSRCAYLLLLARAADAPRNATAVLIWLTIQHLTPLTAAFDFEGGNTPGLARFYTSFGARPLPMLQISASHPRLLAKLLKL